MKERGDQLLAHILRGGNGSATNELLDAFFDGYPIERLCLLLQSDEEHAVKVGAWLASELGEKVTPLMSELSQLLDHPLRYVRFFILDAILISATHECGEVVARAIRLIQDPDEAVRGKTLSFLTNATSQQLTTALPYLNNQTIKALLVWLLDADNPQIDQQVMMMKLDDAGSLTRMFAVAASARLAQRDQGLLEHAATSTDPEVSSFANEQLRTLRIRSARRRKRQK